MAITKEKSSKGPLTAKAFIKALKKYQSPEHVRDASRYFKSGKGEYGEGDKFLGIRMGPVATVAKMFDGMPVGELEKLLESSYHEIRIGAVAIMDHAARRKTTPEARVKELWDLYLRRHDRINNWDLVDLACSRLVGRYLFDKPRKILYQLAKSKNLWERRTAIVGTGYFIRYNQLDDTFRIATLLLRDKEDLIHKGTGWMLRSAGEKDMKRLLIFLDKHAATMPRTMLRYAIEKFNEKKRKYYLGLGKS
jgi:3-methyladenine DNA glycosylase AlkD